MFITWTTFLHIFSISISAVVLGLAQINFGPLLIWTNSIVGALGLVYHITILILNEFRRPPTSRLAKIPWKHRYFIFNTSMKMPKTPLPSYHRHHRSSSSNHSWNNAAVIATIADKSGGVPHKSIPSGPLYSTASLFSIVILTVLTIIGFGMTVEVAMHGTSSLLLSDREKEHSVSFSLGLKAEKAQCAFLGMQALLSLVLLVFCIRGRSRILKAEEETRDENWYGSSASTPKSTELPFPRWDKGAV